MYEELIKRLRYLANVYSICENENTNEYRLAVQAADAIEELQKQLQKSEEDNVNLTGWLAEEYAKHKWIPVTERLPELHKIVLVADKANDIGMGTLETLWDGTVWVVPFEDVDNEFCPISHWMPLPQPPESEEEP